MKKILLSLVFVLSAFLSFSQVPTDTADLRAKINSWLVTNGTKQITATQVNQLFNGVAKLMKAYAVDSGYRVADTLFLSRRGGFPTIKVTLNTGGAPSETDPTVPSVAKALNGSDTSRWNNKQDALTQGTGITIVANVISAGTTTAQWNANKLQGNNISNTSPSTGQVLKWNGSAWSPANDSIAAGGGSADSTTFSTNYRRDTSVANVRTQIATKLNVSDTTNKWLNNLRRRPGTDTVEYFKNGLWQYAFKDTLGSGGSGEVNTASNVGSGIGVFKTKSSVDLQFKSIITPGSVTTTSNSNDVAIQLSGDDATPGTNKVYGTNASGTKGYQSSTVVNLTSPVNGQILKYMDGEWINIDYTPYYPELQITFRVGIDAAMGTGDSVYTDPLLVGRNVKVHREGELMYRDTVFGIAVDTSTGTITFHPYLSTGEKIIIETANYSTTNPIASLQDLDFPTVVNITHTGTTWSATSSGTIYAGYGRCNKKLASGENGYIQARYTTTDGSAAIIAFNTSNINEPFADVPGSPTVYNYEAGGFLAAGQLYYLDNSAAPGTTGYTLSIGDYWRIVRSGSILKLQTSPDGTTWTDRHTYAFSSTADLYINCNIDANTGANKLFEPKGYNLQ